MSGTQFEYDKSSLYKRICSCVAVLMPVCAFAQNVGGMSNASSGLLSGMTLTLSTPKENYEEVDPTFTISGVSLLGQVLVPKTKIDKLIENYVKRPIRFEDVNKLVEKINLLHSEYGFEVVKVIIPEQELKDGAVLRLELVNARVGKVLVEGRRKFSEKNIRESLPFLKPTWLPNTNQLDKSLRLANDSGAKQLQVTFKDAESTELVDAVVSVQESSTIKSIALLDNTGSGNTGKYRLTYVGQHANVLDRDHTATVIAQTSPGHWGDVKVFGLTYRIPFYGVGGALEMNYLESSVNAGTIATSTANLGVTGKGKNASIKWTQLLDRLWTMDQRISAQLEYKLFKSNVVVEGTTDSLVPDLEARPLTIAYSTQYRSSSALAAAQISLSHNLPSGGKNSEEAYQSSGARQEAKAAFNVVRSNLSWTQAYANQWTIRIDGNAQYTPDALISGEQFGAGGINSVRGFNEREASNDYGIRLGAEATSPQWNPLSKAAIALRGIAFIEGASLRRNKSLEGETSSLSISSTGIGLRVALPANAQLRLDAGVVLNGAGIRPNGRMMLHGNLLLPF